MTEEQSRDWGEATMDWNLSEGLGQVDDTDEDGFIRFLHMLYLEEKARVMGMPEPQSELERLRRRVAELEELLLEKERP